MPRLRQGSPARISPAGVLSAPPTPQVVHEYLQLQMATEPREVFAAVWLDAQNQVIDFEASSVGTLTQTSVFPREVAKAALKHNAASVIFRLLSQMRSE